MLGYDRTNKHHVFSQTPTWEHINMGLAYLFMLVVLVELEKCKRDFDHGFQQENDILFFLKKLVSQFWKM